MVMELKYANHSKSTLFTKIYMKHFANIINAGTKKEKSFNFILSVQR